ncbi:glutathione S-transferase family protein [Rhodobacteraceae bacterium M382]|nr:glutathione S-transferase family protein [Rhodobacteraceae bacterium M382]
MSVRLYSYRYSVYSRIVRMVLSAKQIAVATVEVDPFTDLTDDHLRRHPFGRVPVLEHDAFSLYETGAITRYVDNAFAGVGLQPDDPMAQARMDQVMAIVDSYGYVPLVRQVFSHSVFRPLVGEEGDPQVIATGVAGSRRVLAALEDIAEESRVLSGRAPTLADCHLAPMIDYFLQSKEGRELFAEYPNLTRWWGWVSTWAALKNTDPDLSGLKPRT